MTKQLNAVNASAPPTNVQGPDHGRRTISFYPLADAVDTSSTDFRGTVTASDETNATLLALNEAGHTTGLVSKTLFRQSAEEGDFSAILIWAKPNYPLALHSHRSDCLYFVVSGSAKMGSKTLRAGDSFFVPNGVKYRYTAGPDGVEVLEIRHGVSEIGIDMADLSGSVVGRFWEATLDNRDQWAELDVGPTFGANQQAASTNEGVSERTPKL